MIDVSIIIPCYNSGAFLPDTINSIKNTVTCYLYEIIIINDGSTDENTLNLLEVYRKEGFLILNQENQGPGAARNNGVKHANGNYILLLDSDNTLNIDYIEKTLKKITLSPEIDILYTNVRFFGDAFPRFAPAKFDIKKLLFRNYIDVCTVIKKQSYLNLKGFDTENPIIRGRDDLELWMRAYKAGYNFYFLDEKLYNYRIREDSLITTFSNDNRELKSYQYIIHKHADLFKVAYEELYKEHLFYKHDQKHPIKSLLKYLSLKFKS